MIQSKPRPTQSLYPCSPTDRCVVCSGITHPCYTRGLEHWCGFIGTDELEEFTPEGFEWVGTAPSGQQVFLPLAAAVARADRLHPADEDLEHWEQRKDSRLNSDALQATIDSLIAQDLPQSKLEALLPELARQSERTAADVWRLYRTRSAEVEQQESRDQRASTLSSLLRMGSHELQLQDYLHPSLADPLEKLAGYMGSNGAAMLTTLLPIAASLLKVGTRLELIPATGFYALPVLYTGILAESGSAKSPTQKLLLQPLFRLQQEADEQFNAQWQEWERRCEQVKGSKEPKPDKPLPREYYTVDSTREAIALIQSQQPERGFLGWFDELSGLIHGQNQYRNGRGTDRESILSGRDGTGFKVNRASGKRIHTIHSAYSITGSTQPDTLRQLMGDFSDPSGQWARFLWARLPIQPAPFPIDAPVIDIEDWLYRVYRQLEGFEPRTYSLSSEAKQAYARWYNWLDERRCSETQQGLRSVYAKMKGDTGVLALLLHCLDAAIAGQPLAQQVELDTMRRAIRLSQYYLNQVRLIHAEGESADSLQDQLPASDQAVAAQGVDRGEGCAHERPPYSQAALHR